MLQVHQQNAFYTFLIGENRQRFQKFGNLSGIREKHAMESVVELAIVELNPNNIHSEQEKAKSIKRVLVIYLLFYGVM